MIDYGNNILEHKGRKEEYGKTIRGRNSGKYVRYFEIPSPHPSGKPLDMEVDYYANNDRSVVQIKGSWRKWYLGAGTTRDLTYMDTINCVRAIAQKIDLPFERVMRSRFVNVEIGIGLRFWENMGGIVDGFTFFNGFDPVYEYGRESIRFKGTAYSFVIYDKWSQLMNEAEKREKKVENNAKRKGTFPTTNRLSKKRLSAKMNRDNFSLRVEVNVSNLRDCPPEFTDRNKNRDEREVWVKTPEQILQNWDGILTGLKKIFYNVQFCPYNLHLGRGYLKGKGLTELAMYEIHLAAIAAGGVRNYIQLHVKMLDGKHRKGNIEKRMKVLSNPPKELKKALKECRNKEELLFETFNNAIEFYRNKERFRSLHKYSRNTP